MAEAIRMPLLSDTMKEGIIAEWHKKVGDEVKADDIIAEVETDKATMEVMPYVSGTLLYIAVDKGKGVPINGIMAIIGKPGEDFQHLLSDSPAPTQATANATNIPAPAPAAPVVTEVAPQPAKSIPTDATVVRMPLLSDTMKEGKIVAWHKKVGDKVKSDDTIADVETDKATMEVMPYADGTLLYIGVKEGDAAKINDIIAIIGKPGTDISGLLDGNTTAVATAVPAENATAQSTATTASSSHTHTEESDERIKISPLAKMLASQKGISVKNIMGSGDNGRIIKRDIDNYVPSTQPAPSQVAAVSAPAPTPVASSQPIAAASTQESHKDIPVTQMRKIIAQRLGESMFTAPHFYLTMTINMDNAIEARKAINNVATTKVSFNDMVIKACAMALKKHPAVNSSWMGDFIRQNNHINIGTAVAVDEGLIVPVIKNADQKSLSEIAADAGTLIDKARTKKIQPHEFTGNTFTISNLGMMDIDEFTAIINPPDSCILAVGKIAPTPIVVNNQITIGQQMKITLSCDHRVVDGAVGSKFLQTLKAYLENPVTMLA
jgi:pyruvate dehydrogenase E2 component (dihydrolipoamide acetyltransferase)